MLEALSIAVGDQLLWLAAGLASGTAPFLIFGAAADWLRPPQRSNESHMLWLGFAIFTVPSACIVSSATSFWCRSMMDLPWARRWRVCALANTAFAALISLPMGMVCGGILWQILFGRRALAHRGTS